MTSTYRRLGSRYILVAGVALLVVGPRCISAQEAVFSATPADGQPPTIVNGQPVQLSPEQMKEMAKRGRGGPPGAQPAPPGQPPKPEGEGKKEGEETIHFPTSRS